MNENCRKRNDAELMQLFGDLDILSFVRAVRLNWVGCVNRMDSTRKVSQVFNVNLQGKSGNRTTKKQMVELCTNMLINAKLQTGKRGRKTKADCEKRFKEEKVRTGL